MKRLFDIVFACFVLIAVSPVILVTMLLIWLQDFRTPLYIAPRVGKGEQLFPMIKLRSMVINADKTGVVSTAIGDRRVTPIGHFVRRYKLDEFTQFWNVLVGDMSVVGPRPNVKREVDIYTKLEKDLLLVKPGITDFASIVFADEGEILKDCKDTDLEFQQLIRPWKSRLGLFYIEKQSLLVDFQLIYLTGLTLLNRTKALNKLCILLSKLGADSALIKFSRRQDPIVPTPPPGSEHIVTSMNKV